MTNQVILQNLQCLLILLGSIIYVRHKYYLTPSQYNATIITMGRPEKILTKILRGTSDANIPFADLCQLLKSFGFDLRIKGDHHIFTMEGIEEILNLQPKGAKTKVYQVKQVRKIILQYHLMLEGGK